MQQKGVPRQLTEKEMALVRSHRDRQERYFRTALFVQSKWFIVGGALAIVVFFTIIFLLA